VDVHFVMVSTQFWCVLLKYPFPILRRPQEMVFPSDTAWLARQYLNASFPCNLVSAFPGEFRFHKKHGTIGMGRHLYRYGARKAKGIQMALDVKDIMFPSDLKRIFAQVLKAQKEGLAALKKAGGETAALRNLANAAKMVKDNPALLQLRVLQTLEVGRGNSIVLGFPPEATPILPKGAESDGREG